MIMGDKILRKELVTKNFGWFFHIYFSHYVQFPTGDFHWEIYEDLAREDVNFIELIAFRGSAKSTIAALAFPIWCAVTGRKKFIILISDTFAQAKLHIANIIYELENNELLIDEFGPFEGKSEWSATNVVLEGGTRILSMSTGKKVRGLRHLQYRPDLIIADDVENNDSVRQKEQRDKTAEWFGSEVMPAIDTEKGKLILIGNLLHSDSLLARQRKKIIENEGFGILKEYPIIKDGEILWKERFNKKDIERLELQSGSRFFQREYLLKLIPEEGQIIKSVQYYSKLPKVTRISIGVDLAISQKQTADYTAINVLAKCVDGNYYNLKTFAGRWDFHETLERINQVYTTFANMYQGIPKYLGIEDVAYQRAALQEFHRRYKIKPKPIKRTIDKRARLEAIEPYFDAGQIFFREEGDEDLITELLNFGIEQHDDLMDAFEISLTQLLTTARPDIRVL